MDGEYQIIRRERTTLAAIELESFRERERRLRRRRMLRTTLTVAVPVSMFVIVGLAIAAFVSGWWPW